MGLKSFIGKSVDVIKNIGNSPSVKQNFDTLPTANFVATGIPTYRNLSTDLFLLKCYETNPIVQSTINIKAEAKANVKFEVKILATEEIMPLDKYTQDKGKLNSLLKQPNPLQSTNEWIKQMSINFDVFGNMYGYANIPVGYEEVFDYTDISTISNLYSYNITPVLTGKLLTATTKKEIISSYQYKYMNRRDISIPTEQVMHLNNSNIRFDTNFTQGVSKLISLKQPISNIDGAYEARNVLIYKRGADGILSSEKSDAALGNIPLTNEEVEQVQEAYEKYGGLNGQYRLLISEQPLKYQRMAMSVKELMLFEEIESDAITIANAFGVPELLVKQYIKGGTFENLNASEKRLYDSTVIPEMETFMIALNSFLKTEDLGIELIASFSHVKALQKNQKEESEVKKNNVEAAEKLFKIGAVDYNYVLACVGEGNNPVIGGKYIWDLTPEQLNAIGINNTKKVENVAE